MNAKPFDKPFDILDHAHFVCGFGRVRANEPAPIPDIPARPDDLDVLHMDNADIESVVASAVHAEESGELPRMVYSPSCPVMAEEARQVELRE